MLCISAAYAIMRCLCVCPSVTFASCVKMNKDNFKFFSPSGSQAILVFPCQTGWRYSDRDPLTGASTAGGVGKKRDSERISLQQTLHTGLQCCKPYKTRSVKNKAARDSWQRPLPLFAQDDDEVSVMRSTLYARDGGQTHRTQPPWS